MRKTARGFASEQQSIVTMIKRQFYSLEHRSRDDRSSSSSDSDESDTASTEAFPPSDNETSPPAQSSPRSCSEDESEGEVEFAEEPNVLHYSDKELGEAEHKNSSASWSNQWADLVEETLGGKFEDFDNEYVIRCKGVLKCRICPTTLCLSSQTMQAHLTSKKHVRSLKHMREGKLKVMLNSDGEAEEQGETHAERHARTIASVEQLKAEGNAKRKKGSGPQRQDKRVKRKAILGMEAKESTLKEQEQTTSETLVKKKRRKKFLRKKSKSHQAKSAS